MFVYIEYLCVCYNVQYIYKLHIYKLPGAEEENVEIVWKTLNF